MKINNFQGDLTDISAETKPLSVLTQQGMDGWDTPTTQGRCGLKNSFVNSLYLGVTDAGCRCMLTLKLTSTSVSVFKNK